ncbi:hypothetical protein OAL13_00720 [bacterium]|nr:hypothetical protein [bacterium]
MPSVEHLKQHQYQVAEGDEPLGKKPISIRLYASDDEAIRAMGKDGRLFVRKAVRMLLRQRADRHANTGPSSTYE